MTQIDRVVLVGFSGTGKSTVARLVGKRLGWDVIDTDAAVEDAAGCTVPEIFARDGEAAFRAAERRALDGALRGRRVVIATGGGAVVDATVWDRQRLGGPGVLTVALDAAPATVIARLIGQRAAEGESATRPMLAAPNPLGRATMLKAARQEVYDRAAITLVVDGITADEVAAEVVDLVRANPDEPDVRLDAPSGASAIFVRPGEAMRLGARARGCWPASRRAWVVTDERVGALHLDAAAAALAAAGFDVQSRAVPPGEGSKQLDDVGRLLDWLLDGGAERGDIVVALGGGVVGDLAGFVAATCLRGLGLVQVPTSLLAMVDSSVGGKTGVNHRAGKNLIGAFYQPPLVAIDPAYLRTLPPRDRTSGWAEIVKHAIIQPSTLGGDRGDLAEFLARNATGLLAGTEPAMSYLVRRNVALKAAVVREDEREGPGGGRTLLNFGHTLGHAIEAAGYRYLHGEAIAVGIRAAARIGAAHGTCEAADVARIDGLLDRFGLPAVAEVEEARVLALIGSDKKRTAGRQRWVLPVAGGGVTIRDDVDGATVAAALAAVTFWPGAAAGR